MYFLNSIDTFGKGVWTRLNLLWESEIYISVYVSIRHQYLLAFINYTKYDDINVLFTGKFDFKFEKEHTKEWQVSYIVLIWLRFSYVSTSGIIVLNVTFTINNLIVKDCNILIFLLFCYFYITKDKET